MAHKWQERDDIKVLYITLYGIKTIPYTKSDIAKQIGVTIGSLQYRIGNFKGIQGVGKVTHVAKLSNYVYEKYGLLCEQVLRRLAFNTEK